MADNIPIDPSILASAKSIATDDVAGVHYQIVKLAIGSDGSATLVEVALPITVASLPLPSGAATETTVADILAKLPGTDEAEINDLGATYLYECKAPPGTASSSSSWKVARTTLATGIKLYADGNAAYDNIADNRASLSYS